MDRSTLLEYFRRRHDLHEKLTLISLDSKYESLRRIANLKFRLQRVADDFKVKHEDGKGAFDCETGTIMVWSM